MGLHSGPEDELYSEVPGSPPPPPEERVSTHPPQQLLGELTVGTPAEVILGLVERMIFVGCGKNLACSRALEVPLDSCQLRKAPDSWVPDVFPMLRLLSVLEVQGVGLQRTFVAAHPLV